MDSKSILRIDGVRYTMNRLKAGTYRQVLLLGEDYKNHSDEDFVEDMIEIIRVAFGLTKEQAAQIDMDTVVPTFRAIQQRVRTTFIERAAEVPNEEGPEETELPGQS